MVNIALAMTSEHEPESTTGRAERLTEKQTAVLVHLARGLTTKEIAGKLRTSDSSVNRHIEILRARFGPITRAQLAQRYRENPRNFAPIPTILPGVESTKQIIDLAGPPTDEEEGTRDSPMADLAFRDSLEMTIDAPWTRPEQPRVVPRVLDGKNAGFVRGAAIAIILVGIIASLVLGLAAAQAITETLGS